jgi:hypothetical protein
MIATLAGESHASALAVSGTSWHRHCRSRLPSLVLNSAKDVPEQMLQYPLIRRQYAHSVWNLDPLRACQLTFHKTFQLETQDPVRCQSKSYAFSA